MSLSATGAELVFETFSQRYEPASTVVTSNLPFEDWTSVLGSERLTGALLDRLAHHVNVLAMNGDSYRLKQSAARAKPHGKAEQNLRAAEDGIAPQTDGVVKWPGALAPVAAKCSRLTSECCRSRFPA